MRMPWLGKFLFLAEGDALAILLDEVKVIGDIEYVAVADDVLVHLNIAENVDLVERAFLQLFVFPEASDGDYFDCVLLFMCIVDDSVDFRVDPEPIISYRA